MKVSEITEDKQEIKGTYAAYHFSDKSAAALKAFCEEHGIPKSLKIEDFHSTLLYSKKYLPEYKPAGRLAQPLKAKPVKLEVWESPPNAFKADATNCLVLKYECKEQVDRFNQLMDEHDAQYDYDEYKTHVTLSYDIGDFAAEDLDVGQLPELELVEEYGEDLNLDKTFDHE